ncbi:MAG TPA: c-type cytochrome [Puia sp.]|jgi:hypothetical protein|nr:c-type cytochrome [Puia sp.]
MKLLTILIVLIAAVGFGAAATGKRQFENLKVLPKDISSKDLQGVMADDFEDGLGVSCGFCHASAPGGHGLDFASDAKPEKEVARRMMRMTLDLNKKYFAVRKPRIGSNSLTITCVTCHKGEPFPDGDALH